MKRFTILLLCCIASIVMFGKSIKVTFICNDNESEVYQDSLISMKAFFYDDEFITVVITNLTEERIYIEWENARLEDERVLFPDDTNLTKGRERPDEAVAKNSSTKKSFTSEYYLNSNIDMLSSIAKRRKIKKEGFQLVKLNIPIKYKGVSIDMPMTLRLTFR